MYMCDVCVCVCVFKYYVLITVLSMRYLNFFLIGQFFTFVI